MTNNTFTMFGSENFNKSNQQNLISYAGNMPYFVVFIWPDNSKDCRDIETDYRAHYLPYLGLYSLRWHRLIGMEIPTINLRR